MNKTFELLNMVYQNSLMGMETSKHFLSVTDNEKFKEHLKYRISGYADINDEAERLLSKTGREGEKLNPFIKFMANLEIKMKTMSDKSSSLMSEMLMEGNQMGIIEAIRTVKDCNGADKNALDLAGKLIKYIDEENSLLREFL